MSYWGLLFQLIINKGCFIEYVTYILLLFYSMEWFASQYSKYVFKIKYSARIYSISYSVRHASA